MTERARFGRVRLRSQLRSNSGQPISAAVVALAPELAKAVEAGRAQSPTFRSLVAAIEARGAIAYVSRANPPTTRRRVRARTVHRIGVDGLGRRVVHVQVYSIGSAASLASTIGHELQHVIELLDGLTESQFVVDGVMVGTGTVLETKAAQDAGMRVLREMRRGRPD